jgi:PleD family two-component response regulator
VAGDEEISAFVQRADKAMYNAKQTGRNRICVLT